MVEFPYMAQLARPKSGHFDLGTGYHGDLWLDLDALLLRPSLLRTHVRWLAARYHLSAVQGGIDDWRVGVVDDAVNAGTAVVA